MLLKALLALSGCGEQLPDDPSAYTELGVPGPRWQLGWGVQDVPWETMGIRDRAHVLAKQLEVLQHELDGPERAEALALERRLDALDLSEPTDEVLAALEEIKAAVIRLDP